LGYPRLSGPPPKKKEWNGLKGTFPEEKPGKHLFNQMIKVNFTGNIHHYDVPRCDALRRAHDLSDIFSNNIRIQSNDKETLDRLRLWDNV